MFEHTAVELSGFRIGQDHPVFVIGEVGLNHNGNLSLAKRLIEVAAVCGANAAKFQKRDVANLAIRSVLDARDDRFPEFGRTYREIREHLEFGREEYLELKHYCEDRQLVFLCTPFDVASVDFLEELGVSAYKVASHSVTNLPFLEYLSQLRKPVVMSTGMCTLEELDEGVAVFKGEGTPLILLHCVSSYPQKAEESNLRMIEVLARRYQVPIGYSGHEIGYLPTLAAVGRGAVAVERHITLSRSLTGFDHRLSLEPDELFRMVRDIREVEKVLGTGAKQVSETEMVTRRKYHVSIVSKTNIPAGETIQESMLTFKNPGTGLLPRRMGEVINRRAKVFIPADTLVDLEMLV